MKQFLNHKFAKAEQKSPAKNDPLVTKKESSSDPTRLETTKEGSTSDEE